MSGRQADDRAPEKASAPDTPASPGDRTGQIVKIDLDERTVGRRTPEVEHERAVAIYDLIEDNRFRLLSAVGDGPYHVLLGIEDDRLQFKVANTDDQELTVIPLPLRPFRRVIKEYFLICESYFDAIKSAPASRIEAIDMGRRGLHDEGSQTLRERLAPHVDIDHATARRLFTLVCVLHVRA
ncbi:MAG: UPF0262 family protein [Pseudomonadota bacterium]